MLTLSLTTTNNSFKITTFVTNDSDAPIMYELAMFDKPGYVVGNPTMHATVSSVLDAIECYAPKAFERLVLEKEMQVLTKAHGEIDYLKTIEALNRLATTSMAASTKTLMESALKKRITGYKGTASKC